MPAVGGEKHARHGRHKALADFAFIHEERDVRTSVITGDGPTPPARAAARMAAPEP